MKKNGTFRWIIGIIAGVAAATAAITAFLIYQDKKKKEDAELEDYLENSIQ